MDSVAISDSFNRTYALQLAGRYGIPFLIALLVSLAFLFGVRFRLDRFPSFVAERAYLRTQFFQFGFNMRWVLIALKVGVFVPLIFLLVWGIVMCVGIDPPVIGFLLVFYTTSLVSMGYALGRWYYDSWKWSTAVANAGLFSTAMYLAFQIGTVFVKPYSFFGISICMLSINMLPIIQIILIQTPEYRLNFQKFLSMRNNPKFSKFLKNYGWDSATQKEEEAKAIAKHGQATLFSGEISRKTALQDSAALYLIALAVLFLYSCLVAALIQETPYLGLALSCTLVVVDFTLLMYARLALHPPPKKPVTNNDPKSRAYLTTTIMPDSTDHSTTRFKPANLIIVSVVVRIILSGFGSWWFVGDSAVYLVFGTLLARYIVVHRLDLDNHQQHKVHISSLLRQAMAEQRMQRARKNDLRLQNFAEQNSPDPSSGATGSGAGLEPVSLRPQPSDDGMFGKSAGPAPVRSASEFDHIGSMGSLNRITVTLDEARDLPQYQTGVRYVWWKLKRWSSYPEFVLGFLTLFFIILLIVVAFIKPNGVPLPEVPLYDQSHEQYKFGVFAFLFVVNAFFVMWTWGLYQKAKQVDFKLAMYALFTELTIIGSGQFIFWLTTSWIILFLSIFIPPIAMIGHLTYVKWRDNDYQLLASPQHRNPPLENAFIAFWRGGLNADDYLRLGGSIIYLALTCIFGYCIYLKLDPSWTGMATAFIMLVVSLTWVTVQKWTNSLHFRQVAPTTILTAALIIAYALYFWLVDLDGAASEKALALLFLVVVYPSVIMLYCGLYKFRQDKYHTSTFTRVCTLITMILLLAFIIVLYVFVSIIAGAALSGVYLALLYVFMAIRTWRKNKKYLPPRWRLANFLILAVVAGMGVVIGIFSDSSLGVFVGISVSWGCIFVSLWLVPLSRDMQFATFSPKVFPVYFYDRSKDTVVEGNWPILCGFVGLVMCMIWGVFFTLVIEPHSAGIAVLALSLVVGFAGTAALRQSSSLEFARAIAPLTLVERDEITYESIVRAEAIQFQWLDDRTKAAANAEAKQAADTAAAVTIDVNNHNTAADTTQSSSVFGPVKRHRHRSSLPEAVTRFASMLKEKVAVRGRWARIESSKASQAQTLDQQLAALLGETEEERERAIETHRLQHRTAFSLQVARRDLEKSIQQLIDSQVWEEGSQWAQRNMLQGPDAGKTYWYHKETGICKWQRPVSVDREKELVGLLRTLPQADIAVNEAWRQETKFSVHLQVLITLAANAVSAKREAEFREFLITSGYPHLQSNTSAILTISDDRMEELFAKMQTWMVQRRQRERERLELMEEERRRAENRRQVMKQLERDGGARRTFTMEEAEIQLTEIQKQYERAKRYFDESKGKVDGLPTAPPEPWRDTTWGPLMPGGGANAIGMEAYGTLAAAEASGTLGWARPPYGDGKDASEYSLFNRKTPLETKRYDVEGKDNEGYTFPIDVVQGALGDCYLMSALAVMANTKKVKDLFIGRQEGKETKRYSEAGVYAIRFWKHGKWQCVLVDDWLPTTANGKIAYCRADPKAPSMWAALVEKAYAKYHFNYGNIIGGFVSDALTDLGGPDAAAEELKLQMHASNPEAIWVKLKKYNELGFLMGAHTPASPVERVTPLGIVLGHAYSILRVVEESDDNGTHRLIQLRNPQGMREWFGAWSDDSEEWTQKMKERLNYTQNAVDGLFWMSLSDLIKEFASIFICRMFEAKPWAGNTKTMKGEWSILNGTAAGYPDGKNAAQDNDQYAIYVTRPTDFFIRLNQSEMYEAVQSPNEMKSASGQRYEPQYIGFVMLKNNGLKVATIRSRDDLVADSGGYMRKREVTWEGRLEPMSTPYTLVPSTYDAKKEGKYELIIHSTSSNVRVEKITSSESR